MDRFLSFLLLFALVLGQLAVYCIHRLGRGRAWSGPRYRVSLPTRLFRWAKAPLYLTVVLHLVLDVLMSDPGPAPRALFLALSIGAAALLLLHRSLTALGANFAPCDRGVLPRELVRAGPYRWLSHPIYVANLLLVTAVAVASPGPLIVATGAALAVFYAFASRDESRALRRLGAVPAEAR